MVRTDESLVWVGFQSMNCYDLSPNVSPMSIEKYLDCSIAQNKASDYIDTYIQKSREYALHV